MGKPIDAYIDTDKANTGGVSDTEAYNSVTATRVNGKKWAMDAYIRGGSISGGGLALDGVNRDYVSLATPDSVTEVYTYRLGGSGGTTTETVTIVYTDSTKCQIVDATVVVA